MNALYPFKKLSEQMSESNFLNHCKHIVLEKENYAKIVVQKAQQFIDGNTSILSKEICF